MRSVKENLNLSNMAVCDAELKSLLDNCDVSILEDINLSNNKISNDGAFMLCNIINSMPKLKHINLDQNKIESDGAIQLVKAFNENPSAQHLSLKENPIGRKAVNQLCPFGVKQLVFTKTSNFIALDPDDPKICDKMFAAMLDQQ